MKFLMKWISIIGVIVSITSIYFVLGRPADAGGVVVSEVSAQRQSSLSNTNSLEEQIRSLDKYLYNKVTESYKDIMKTERSLVRIERSRYEAEAKKKLERIKDLLEFTKELVDSGEVTREELELHAGEVVVGYERDLIPPYRLGHVWRPLSDF